MVKRRRSSYPRERRTKRRMKLEDTIAIKVVKRRRQTQNSDEQRNNGVPE